MAADWFHCNADTGLLTQLLPIFDKAHMLDGHLVDYDLLPIRFIWRSSVSNGGQIEPQRLMLGPGSSPTDAMAMATKVLQVRSQTGWHTCLDSRSNRSMLSHLGACRAGPIDSKTRAVGTTTMGTMITDMVGTTTCHRCCRMPGAASPNHRCGPRLHFLLT